MDAAEHAKVVATRVGAVALDSPEGIAALTNAIAEAERRAAIRVTHEWAALAAAWAEELAARLRPSTGRNMVARMQAVIRDDLRRFSEANPNIWTFDFLDDERREAA